jgi:hypothetical protein
MQLMKKFFPVVNLRKSPKRYGLERLRLETRVADRHGHLHSRLHCRHHSRPPETLAQGGHHLH